jgi:hypothetical protein
MLMMSRTRILLACVSVLAAGCTSSKEESTVPTEKHQVDEDAPAHVDEAGQAPSPVAAADAGVAAASAPLEGLDRSYWGHYESYPPDQDDNPRAPVSIEIVDQKQGQLKGGLYSVNLRVTLADGSSSDATVKYDPKDESLRGYAVLSGDGLRYRFEIKEVRPGYDLHASFTSYKGETAEETGSFEHSYRKKR